MSEELSLEQKYENIVRQKMEGVAKHNQMLEALNQLKSQDTLLEGALQGLEMAEGYVRQTVVDKILAEVKEKEAAKSSVEAQNSSENVLEAEVVSNDVLEGVE